VGVGRSGDRDDGASVVSVSAVLRWRRVGGTHLLCAREGSRGELARVKVVVPSMIGGSSWTSGMAVRRDEASRRRVEW
jgi:hypothetical protein